MTFLEKRHSILPAALQEEGMILHDRDGNIIACNREAESILGYAARQMIGKTLLELPWQIINSDGESFLPETHPAIVALRTGKVCQNVEMGLFKPNGEQLWLNFNSQPLFKAEAIVPHAVVTTFTQIVSKKPRENNSQAEEALRESEDRFRTLADNISQLAWMADETGGIFWYNLRWFDYTGTTLEEMKGWGWQKVHHPEHVDRVIEKIAHCFETGEPWEDVFPLRSCNGEYRWFLSRAIPIKDRKGKVTRWFGTNTDITESRQIEQSLRQREAELQLVTNAVPALISFIDENQCYRFNNQAYEKWFGQFGKGIIGKHLREVLGESAYLEIRPYVERVLRGETVTYESRISYKDGVIRDVSATYVPDFDDWGRMRGFVALIVDISERKIAEAAIRLSEERARLAIEVGRLGTWRYDPNSQIVELDRRMREIWGEPDDAVQSSFSRIFERIHPSERERVSAAIDRAIDPKSSGAYEIEFRIVWDDGSERWVSAKGQAQFTREGDNLRCLDFIGTALDITNQKQAEIALSQSEGRFRRIFECNMVPMGIWSKSGEILQANDALLDLIGHTREELESQQIDWQAMTPPELLLKDDRALTEIATKGFSTPFEKEYIHKMGRRIPILIGGACFSDEPESGIFFAIDLSDRKRAEAERERLLAREHSAREAAEAANRTKDEFLAVLSHELRSPLNPILGWSQLLRARKKLDEAMVLKGLETIERNVLLQIQLIDDLLDVSKILQGKLVLNIAPVDLVFAVTAALETVHLAASSKAIEIQTEIEPKILRVNGDEARLQQVVWNIVSNAVKFTPNGGKISVRLEKIDAMAQIRVRDTGKGISPDFLPHVFEYFRQADSSITRKFGGLGLGLALVRHIVELHGGTVTAESPGEGHGATFTVRLPLPVICVESTQSQAPSAEMTTDLSALRILVVDDDESTREFVVFALEQYGAIVTSAAEASEALLALAKEKFDILLSDIGMPEVNGYALIRQVRNSNLNGCQYIPAIALSAYASERDRTFARQAGFQHHIAKPVDLCELFAAIDRLAKRDPA